LIRFCACKFSRLIAFPLIKETKQGTNLHYDILITLSSLKIGEIDDPYVQDLISQGLITDLNKSILEQMGEFYITDIDLARSLGDSILLNLKTNKNIGIWYENDLIASISSTPYETAENIETARLIISGIREGESATGFSARSFLSNSLLNKYFYFGGYVGDGNLSANIDYTGNISSAKMEMAINKQFEVLVNGNSLGILQGSTSEFTPSTYNLSIQHFQSGENLVEIKGDNLHIAGGFIKITYASDVEFQQPIRYKFPGIKGLINLYDGMYIPSDLTSILVSLHMNSPTVNIFLNIGGVTVYNSTTIGEQTITLTDTELLSMGLSHEALSNTTTPIRLGIENVTLIINASLDLVSVTDKSTNMQCTISTGNCAQNPNTCAACGGIWLLPLNQSRDANILLVEQILQFPNNRVGVLGFHSQVAQANHLPLSNDSDFLLNDPQKGITNWDETYTGGNHKLCQAIIETEQEFIEIH